MRILFFGDIIGKPGRHAVRQAIQALRQEFQPDVVLANVENLAHGIGVSGPTLAEIQQLGIAAFTSGNHVFHGKDGASLVENASAHLIRPANFPPGNPGKGYELLPVAGKTLLLVNAIGRVFFRESYDDPYRAVEQILAEHSGKADAIMIDFHAEATSEKRAFGFAFDGQVSAIVGTHTHVPTADAQLLQKGTAYISDVGMVGPLPSIIGVKPEPVIRQFRIQTQGGLQVEEDMDTAEIGAVIIDADRPDRASRIEHIRRIVKLDEAHPAAVE